MFDRLASFLVTTAPIQETLHVTRYPSSIWVLVLMQAFLLLPVVLVSIAMLFLHRANANRKKPSVICLGRGVVGFLGFDVGVDVARVGGILPPVGELVGVGVEDRIEAQDCMGLRITEGLSERRAGREVESRMLKGTEKKPTPNTFVLSASEIAS